MGINWEQSLQVGVGTWLGILNTTKPRLSRASLWLGRLAMVLLGACLWLALPIGPLRVPLLWLVARANQASFASMSFSERILVSGAAGLLTGLLDAAGQLADVSGVRGDESVEELRRKIRDNVQKELEL